MDGASNATTTINVGAQPGAVAVDAARKQIYISNGKGLCLSVIDGKTNAVATVGDAGNGALARAADILTNEVYVGLAGASGSTVAVLGRVNSAPPYSLTDELRGTVNGVR
jgi:DNA-binding beta-propeller fold protein YncE